MEKKYLKLIVDTIPQSGSILDVGCGSGEPLAKYFIEKDYSLVGVDNSDVMIELCCQRYPKNKWLLMDMRSLNLDRQFDCVIAWHSFFHLPKEEQEAVLVNMICHVAESGLLVFTSGIENSF
jgi:2-polyprenyl-3-methyl-5-hydroxy-6-metoxy-1,4-benzoquinol methylase